jgi:hypothetical protein
MSDDVLVSTVLGKAAVARWCISWSLTVRLLGV